MLRFSGSSQNPGSSVLDELQLSNGLLWKAGEETITLIHPAGDKGMNKFLQVLTGNKTSNSCNVFEMIVCWFSYCFDMTTEAKVCLQNHPKISDLIFSWLLYMNKPLCKNLQNENKSGVYKCKWSGHFSLSAGEKSHFERNLQMQIDK